MRDPAGNPQTTAQVALNGLPFPVPRPGSSRPTPSNQQHEGWKQSQRKEAAAAPDALRAFLELESFSP
ncbi:MAG: hypothetical protein ACK55I_46490, partial [bacterium]